jgi:PAS domain S-box-containing protein
VHLRHERATRRDLVLVLVLLLTVPVSSLLPERPATLVADLAVIVVDVLVGCWATARARRYGAGRLRASWWLLASSFWLWAVADSIWLFENNFAAVMPYPSYADLFYMVGYGPTFVAMLLLPGDTLRATRRGRLALDALVAAAALSLAGFLVPLEEVFGSAPVTLGAALDGAYVLVDIVIVGLVVLMMLRATGLRRPDLLLVAAGFSTWAAADAGFALLNAHGGGEGHMALDFAYVAAPMLVGLAARAPDHTLAQAPDWTGAGALGSMLPDVAVVLALLTCAFHGFHHRVDWVLAGAIVSLAALRQVFLAWDNLRLTQGLEQRIADRSADLDRLARQHERILTSVGEGIYGVDLLGRISFVNSAAARLLGAETGDLVGQSACAVFHMEEPEGSASCMVESVMRTESVSYGVEAEYRRSDGACFPVEVTAAPQRDATGVTGAVVVFRDISERRAMEQMKSEFISVVSHELRTPLTSITGALGLLADGDTGDLPEESQHVVAIALRGSLRLGRLINDILDIDRLESGAVPLNLADHTISDLVETAVYAVQGLADAHHVRLAVQADGGTIRADGDRLVQALVNLLGNAVKFSPAAETVTLQVRAGAGAFTFSVTDRGRGIPASALASVFERFCQVEPDDARTKGGSGLGLAITRSIVERHGGRIWVDSEIGAGSVFTFVVPVFESAGAAPSEERHQGHSPVLHGPG